VRGKVKPRSGKKQVGFIIAKPTAKDLALLGELLAAGRIRPVIERRYNFRDVPAAIQHLQLGPVTGKLVISMGLEPQFGAAR